jgi:aminopeptidase N
MLCLAARHNGDVIWPGKAYQRFKDAGNMTDRFNALSALVGADHALAVDALARFHALFQRRSPGAGQMVCPAGRRT